MTRRQLLCSALAVVGAMHVVGAEERLRIVPLVHEKQMVVSLEIADAYTDDIREAISSGLRTTFSYDVELRMLVAGWVDRTIASSVVSISVQYDNLTSRHSLSRTVDGRIDEAVVTEDEEVVAKWLTSVERLPLCATAKLERNRDYYVRVNARKRPQRTFPFAWTGPDQRPGQVHLHPVKSRTRLDPSTLPATAACSPLTSHAPANRGHLFASATLARPRAASATAGMKNVVADARVAPIRPAATATSTLAMPVPSAPSASMHSAARTVHLAWSSAGRPSGAVRTRATARARHTTGSAPLRCCSGRARLMATP